MAGWNEGYTRTRTPYSVRRIPSYIQVCEYILCACVLVHCGNFILTCAQLITGRTSHVESFVLKSSIRCLTKRGENIHTYNLPSAQHISMRNEKKGGTFFYPVHWQDTKLINSNNNHIMVTWMAPIYGWGCRRSTVVEWRKKSPRFFFFWVVRIATVELVCTCEASCPVSMSTYNGEFYLTINRIDCFHGPHNSATLCVHTTLRCRQMWERDRKEERKREMKRMRIDDLTMLQIAAGHYWSATDTNHITPHYHSILSLPREREQAKTKIAKKHRRSASNTMAGVVAWSHQQFSILQPIDCKVTLFQTTIHWSTVQPTNKECRMSSLLSDRQLCCNSCTSILPLSDWCSLGVPRTNGQCHNLSIRECVSVAHRYNLMSILYV